MLPKTAEAPNDHLALWALEGFSPAAPGEGVGLLLIAPPPCCPLAPGVECQTRLFSVVSEPVILSFRRTKCSS